MTDNEIYEETDDLLMMYTHGMEMPEMSSLDYPIDFEQFVPENLIGGKENMIDFDHNAVNSLGGRDYHQLNLHTHDSPEVKALRSDLITLQQRTDKLEAALHAYAEMEKEVERQKECLEIMYHFLEDAAKKIGELGVCEPCSPREALQAHGLNVGGSATTAKASKFSF